MRSTSRLRLSISSNGLKPSAASTTPTISERIASLSRTSAGLPPKNRSICQLSLSPAPSALGASTRITPELVRRVRKVKKKSDACTPRDLWSKPPQPACPSRSPRWFKARGWHPHAHQLALLEHAGAGRDTLLIAPTGGGKTLAGFLPSLVDLARRAPKRKPETAIHTLYVSPLKALAVDIARNLADAGRRDGAADQIRDPHRRYAAVAPRAPARPAARHPADDA